MRDKDGFIIPCKNSDWRIFDYLGNKSYICMLIGDKGSGYHECFGDENCRYYEPRRLKSESMD